MPYIACIVYSGMPEDAWEKIERWKTTAMNFGLTLQKHPLHRHILSENRHISHFKPLIFNSQSSLKNGAPKLIVFIRIDLQFNKVFDR